MNRRLGAVLSIASLGLLLAACSGMDINGFQPASIDILWSGLENPAQELAYVKLVTRDGVHYHTLSADHSEFVEESALGGDYSVTVILSGADQVARVHEDLQRLKADAEQAITNIGTPRSELNQLVRDYDTLSAQLAGLETSGSLSCTGTVEPGGRSTVVVLWVSAGYADPGCDVKP